ncbi:MAG: CinA family protein [Clostridia bacterium]|nr:CinA family protein [Clostridia bacterium]
MKNACIVLCNKKNSVKALEYTAITDAFLSAGYFFDEIVLLPYEDIAVFHQKVRTFAESFDLCCVAVDPVILDGARNNLSDTFGFSFEEGIAVSGRCLTCILPLGEAGGSIVSERVVPLLNERMNMRYDRMILRMVGAPQEVINEALAQAYELSGEALNYNFSEDYDDQRLEMIYDSRTPKMLADSVMRTVLRLLNDYVYALDDTTLEKRVYEGLCLRKLKLAIAESFTGGRVSARMVKVSGVSSVYLEGLNTYSNQAKMARLNVNAETLRHSGAVSAETAHEMAEGLFETTGCGVCVATTGIAGPKSDDTKKPVGLCYIAAGIEGQIFVNKYVFDGDREKITQTAVNHALFSIYKLLRY